MPHYNTGSGVLTTAVGVAGLAAMMARRRFEARLDGLQARLGEGRAPGTPRNDLPEEAFALAEASTLGWRERSR